MQTQQPSPQQQRKVFRCALCALSHDMTVLVHRHSRQPSPFSRTVIPHRPVFSIGEPQRCDWRIAHSATNPKLPEIGRPQPPVETAPDIIKG
ncbi:hypothetical protein PAPYR_13359 [Paratrimastix pyriformis]|uniref:Uncharacterized protein n=1 Tax=Paratrimastix pyriformis TaxID=342808 RepID=A0ABQ8U0C5_9EUKA|nr:hypothetical protein PAPYR_13359 [Paratrimastix pyriformis]